MAKTYIHPIESARRSRSLTLEGLGSKLGVSRQAVHKWEQGHTHPRPEVAKKLAHVLKLRLEQVYAEAA